MDESIRAVGSITSRPERQRRGEQRREKRTARETEERCGRDGWVFVM